MKRTSLALRGLLIAAILGGCATISGTTPEEKRQSVISMRQETLTDLYKVRPQAQAEIAAAPGYAVFSNANVNLFFGSFGGGRGVVSDKAGKNVYMKMGEVGVGLGLGIKDFRAIFIFKNQATMDRFIRNGWEFGGHADAAAKAGDAGGAVGGEALIDDIKIYQMTKAGLALQLTVKGTKYWKDDELN